MVKGLAVMLALVILSLISIDPLICPDGCTHAVGATFDTGSADHAPDNDCAICHGFTAAIIGSVAGRAAPLSLQVTPQPLTPLTTMPRTIEHPPRFV
jgi:hypothetical protein